MISRNEFHELEDDIDKVISSYEKKLNNEDLLKLNN